MHNIKSIKFVDTNYVIKLIQPKCNVNNGTCPLEIQPIFEKMAPIRFDLNIDDLELLRDFITMSLKYYDK